MSSSNVLVILPTYNERENIVTILTAIRSCIAVDVLVIDDNSPDRTGDIVREMASSRPWLRLRTREQKLGLASAYVEGFRVALEETYEIVIQMDSDYSHDPRYLKDLLDTLDIADLVIGSKYTPGGKVIGLSWWRQILSRWGNLYASLVLQRASNKSRIYDWTSGYMCWRQSALRKINLDAIRCSGYGFLIELKHQAAKSGLIIREVPIAFHDRVAGRSKLSVGILRESCLLPFQLILRPVPLKYPASEDKRKVSSVRDPR